MLGAMSLSSLGTLAIVPPVNLLGLGVLGTAALFWRPRLGRALVVVAMAGLVVLSTPLAADLLLAGLERGLPTRPDPAHPPRAIVILGGEVSRGEGGETDIGPLSLERVRAGAALARRTGLPILVTGGVTTDGGREVGQVMAESLAADFGQPPRWVEPASLDTWENASLSAKLLTADGIDSVYLVTHAWHMRRALIAFTPTAIRAVAAPTGTDGPDWSAGSLVPTASALHRSYYALHEWIGLLYYASGLKS